jgi:general secretion pathway protein A
VLLTGLTSVSATLWQAGDYFEIPLLALDELWLGDYLLLWRPPVGVETALRSGDRGPAVTWLRDALARWSGNGLADANAPQHFDSALAEQVREFQFSLGLDVDGVAGERTLAHLDGLTTADGPRLHAGDDNVADP